MKCRKKSSHHMRGRKGGILENIHMPVYQDELKMFC